MHRLALSDADKEVRDWFVKTTKSLGCDVKIDSMGKQYQYSRVTSSANSCLGNIFAVRPGKKSGTATYAGSHLDTQASLLNCLTQIPIDLLSRRVAGMMGSLGSQREWKP